MMRIGEYRTAKFRLRGEVEISESLQFLSGFVGTTNPFFVGCLVPGTLMLMGISWSAPKGELVVGMDFQRIPLHGHPSPYVLGAWAEMAKHLVL